MKHARDHRRWTRADFARPAAELARALIGHLLIRIDPHAGRLAAVILETEAYTGPDDRASHAFGGRRTPRTEPMYGPPGTSYVYFTYGMHHCFNIACEREGFPAAVLVRAVEPVEGIEVLRANRTAQGKKPPRETDLCNGPGKLCQALAITTAHSGVDLTASAELFIERPAAASDAGAITIATSPRIGIGDKGEWTLAPLRFYVQGHRGVGTGPMGRAGSV